MTKPKAHAIRIVAISGSVRPGSYTAMALAIAASEAAKHPGVTVESFDPADLDLALPGTGTDPSPSLQKLTVAVESATGLLLATPEYHGSYSSVIKLVIDNLGYPSTLSGKPIALLGVAGGQLGAIKAMEHLRSVCSHVGALVLPGPVSIPSVHKAFDEQGNCIDETADRHIRRAANNLIEYIHNHICPKAALEEMARQAAS